MHSLGMGKINSSILFVGSIFWKVPLNGWQLGLNPRAGLSAGAFDSSTFRHFKIDSSKPKPKGTFISRKTKHINLYFKPSKGKYYKKELDDLMNYKGIKDQKFTCLYCGNVFIWKGQNFNNKYCNSICCGKHFKQLNLKKQVDLFEQGKLKYRTRIREILIEKYGNTCSVCGISEWNNKPIVMWVDHIDGNASNNMPNNFRLICPNCESQSETYSGRNLGKGRKTRNISLS